MFLSLLSGSNHRKSTSIFLFRATAALQFFSILSPWCTIKSHVSAVSYSTFPKGAMLVSTRRSVADVYAVPMFKDNYGYFLIDRETGHALTVDPGDGKVICDAAKEHNWDLRTVLCTHKHADHIGGNEYLREKMPSLQFIATAHEPIPCATQLVGEGDTVIWGSLKIRVLNTFCHTAGHVVYFIEKNSEERSNSKTIEEDPILFCGDTLFVGGCGRFFEGTAAQMLDNMDKLSTLPENTQVFCAHEYTESNFKFLNAIDPETVGDKFKEIQQIRLAGKPTIPSSIGEELRYNLFMHCHQPRLQEMLRVSSAVDAMHELRTRKNNF